MTAQAGAVSLDLEGTHVSGPVTTTSVVGAGGTPSTAVMICGSTISGAVKVSGSGGLVQIGGDGSGCTGNTLSGGLNATNNVHGLDVVDNHIGGSTTINGNAPGPDVAGNTIGGSLVCSGNSGGVVETYFDGPNNVGGATLGQCKNETMVK